MSASVTYENIAAAANRLAGVAHRTPVVTSTTFDARAGARVFFKCENLQRAGAFKFRGAYNAIASLHRSVREAGVVTFSSGNHGQALALAARLHGTPVAVVMPRDAPVAKIEATRGYGAEVFFYDRQREDRALIARRLVAERSAALIPPFDHPDVIAGQGTVAKELCEDVGPLDYLVVPVGGGGLIAGSALAMSALMPACKVIGVEPERGNDAQQSLRTGRLVTLPVPDTIADGARTTSLGEITFPIIRQMVDDIVTVRDDELIGAMRFAAERMKLVIEPTGALAVAALLRNDRRFAGKRVGVMISGGNVDAETFARLIARSA